MTLNILKEKKIPTKEYSIIIKNRNRFIFIIAILYIDRQYLVSTIQLILHQD
jgi:hypothetical protein